MTQAKFWGAVATALIFGLTAGALGWKALNAPNAQIEMKFPSGGSLKIDAKQDLADPSTMFAKVFSADFSRAGAMELLRRRNIFAMDDPGLLDAFLGKCPEKLENENDDRRRQRWNDCFQQNRFFAELKGRSDHQKAPFQYLGTDVRVGTPAVGGERPAASHANVCRGGDFMGYDIRLVDPRSKRQIIVHATGFYNCPDTVDFPNVQLNAADAYSLFHRRTQKFESAVAYRQEPEVAIASGLSSEKRRTRE